MAFVMVTSPGGGVLQGDRLELDVRVEEGARLHLDTPSATRLYRMPHNHASSRLRIEVCGGSFCELVPDPYLPYAGARYLQEVDAVVDAGGVLILGEVVAAGRVARGEVLRYERFESIVTARRPEGTLLVRDVCALDPDEGLVDAGRPVLGTLHVVARGFGAGPLADAAAEAGEAAYAGASELPNEAGAWLRVLAPDAATAVRVVGAGWRAARSCLTGASPPPSRRY